MSARDLARNRWRGLLEHFGVDSRTLTSKHTACPVCGGRDRFRFDDREGRGTFFCSKCGAGDGFKLLELLNGWQFAEAAREIEAIVGTIPEIKPIRRSDREKPVIYNRIWRETSALVPGDPVSLYLARRCSVEVVAPVIRFQPRLAYCHDDKHVTYHPAMVCLVQDITGVGCAIHRTYLTDDGEKADVSAPKKLAGKLPAGAAIRLFQPSECVGVAEGVETALSAFVLFGVPTWAAVSARGIEGWTPPDGARRIIVFGDNDASGTGQAAAWALTKRLIATGIETEVRIPTRIGFDWNDIQRGTA